jgi:hypothetical protein
VSQEFPCTLRWPQIREHARTRRNHNSWFFVQRIARWPSMVASFSRGPIRLLDPLAQGCIGGKPGRLPEGLFNRGQHIGGQRRKIFSELVHRSSLSLIDELKSFCGGDDESSWHKHGQQSGGGRNPNPRESREVCGGAWGAVRFHCMYAEPERPVRSSLEGLLPIQR